MDSVDKDENRKLMLSDYIDILRQMIESKTASHIVIETAHMIHSIERLSPSTRDRGRYKWLVEMKATASIEMTEEAQRSHIDAADMFPRYFFLESSLVNEIFQFIIVRGLSILNIVAPRF